MAAPAHATWPSLDALGISHTSIIRCLPAEPPLGAFLRTLPGAVGPLRTRLNA
jgi:hypothetical protein